MNLSPNFPFEVSKCVSEAANGAVEVMRVPAGRLLAKWLLLKERWGGTCRCWAPGHTQASSAIKQVLFTP